MEIAGWIVFAVGALILFFGLGEFRSHNPSFAREEKPCASFELTVITIRCSTSGSMATSPIASRPSLPPASPGS
jgi:hypothetical protein